MSILSPVRTLHYRLLAVLWTIGIVLAMTVPTGSFPDVQSAFGFDKIVHAVLFAGFGVLWLRGLCPPEECKLSEGLPWRGYLLFLAGVLFAIGTEVYQHLIPVRRVGDPYDAAADLLGLLVAFAGYYAYHARRVDRSSA